MPLREFLSVGPIAEKFDRVYKAHGERGEIYEVNVARLTCSCEEFRADRANFSFGDVRRVCAHLYEKLYTTKVEREFELIVQLFVRYGRRMLTYQLMADDLGEFVIGQPFGPRSVRAIGVMGDQPVLATYHLESGSWSSGESDLSPRQYDAILTRMHSALPVAFRNSP
jgi:hypothetical protein